jgi:hypothetical protein
MYYSTATYNAFLNAVSVNRLKLHTGNPGATGADNVYTGEGYTYQSAIFATASDGKRTLSDNVVFTGVPGESVSWLSFWTSGTFRGATELTGTPTFDADTGLLVILPDDTYYGLGDCT